MSSASLPLRRVTLCNNGAGFFEPEEKVEPATASRYARFDSDIILIAVDQRISGIYAAVFSESPKRRAITSAAATGNTRAVEAAAYEEAIGRKSEPCQSHAVF